MKILLSSVALLSTLAAPPAFATKGRIDQREPLNSVSCAKLLTAIASETELKNNLVESEFNPSTSPTIFITDKIPGKLGDQFEVRKSRYNTWMSIATTMDHDPQASPILPLFLFSRNHERPDPLAKALGFGRLPDSEALLAPGTSVVKSLSPQRVILPSLARLNRGIEIVNEQLAPDDAIRIHFVPDEKNVHAYLKNFTESYALPIADLKLQDRGDAPFVEPLHDQAGANHYFHDVNLHSGAVLIPKDVLDFFNVQIKTHLRFLEWMANKDPRSLLNAEGKKLIRERSAQSGKSQKYLARKLMESLVFENKLLLTFEVDLVTGSIPIGIHNEIALSKNQTDTRPYRQFHAAVKRMVDIDKNLVSGSEDARLADHPPSLAMKNVLGVDKNAYHFFDIDLIRSMEPQFYESVGELGQQYKSQVRDEETLSKFCVETLKRREQLLNLHLPEFE